MSFNDEVTSLWTQVIDPAIRDAGYEPLRIDEREHTDKIDDQIFAALRQSRFVVADLTFHRTGVYYEAGFASGLGRHVIWMVREDEADKTHFDIRQYNRIQWKADNLPDARERLQTRIVAVLGQGPLRPAQ